jgi:hypothetical protein
LQESLLEINIAKKKKKKKKKNNSLALSLGDMLKYFSSYQINSLALS